MFIVWGTKAVVRRLGYAADFCPICREIRAFQIQRIGKAGHLYGLTLGSGQLIGHERICLECGVTLRAEASTYQEIARKRPGPDLAALVAATFPRVRERHAERLAVEEQVARRPGSLEGGLRAALLREPFLLVSPEVERRFAQTQVDPRAAAAFGLGLVAALGVSALLARVVPGGRSVAGGAFWVVFTAGIAAAVALGLQSGGRFLRSAVYPKVARALRPLDPSREELEEVLGELRRQGAKLGKKAKLAEIQASLRPANRMVT